MEVNLVSSLLALALAAGANDWRVHQPGAPGKRAIAIPTLDISQQAGRHVIIAAGTKDYEGHATTVLLPDGKTMFCTWSRGHGGPCGLLKRSDDGGRTWSALLPVPANWRQVRNCPAIYRLIDAQGTARLFVFASQGPDGTMHQARSDDGGQSWTPMESCGLKSVMPFCTIEPVDGGRRLLGMTNIRRPGDTQDERSNIIAQSFSNDGGLSWTAWEVVLDIPGCKPCEPCLIRSPDGKQLLCIMRENNRSFNSWTMTSDDEGRSWSEPRQTAAAVSGDRHDAAYDPDGRLLIAFRDTAEQSPTRDHFVGWVGRYEDLREGRQGQYRVKLLHSHAGRDCGYAAVECLPDGTLMATTYIRYRPGEKHSVVGVRLKLDELDKAARQQ